MRLRGLLLALAFVGCGKGTDVVLYSSGHEWGYWLTDYLTAKALWEPERSFESLLAEYTSAFGTCAADVDTTFRASVALQTELLFDKKLIPYLAGEDSHDDLVRGTIVTIPERVPFHEPIDPTILAGLDEYARRSAPILDEIAARCRGSEALPQEPRRGACDLRGRREGDRAPRAGLSLPGRAAHAGR